MMPAEAPILGISAEARSDGQTYLACTYDDKDKAKKAGARWDQSAKKWYVPGGVKLKRFEKWLPESVLRLHAAPITCGRLWEKLQQLSRTGPSNDKYLEPSESDASTCAGPR